ncbi:MAG: hypothetical protein F6K14_11530 [Symploca sp. SIO2C1]|nr:hypothetical protein [Symploca sp. SIO2C1]
MKDYTCIDYQFHHHKVRVFCKPNGREGIIVLEDILKILFPAGWESLLEDKLDFVKSKLVPISIEEDDRKRELYSAYPDDAMEFWSYCDDAKDEDLYEEIGNWLEHKVCSPIEQGIAHVADTLSRFENIPRYATKTIKEGNSDKFIPVNNWVESEYNIEIPWLRTQIVKMHEHSLSYTHRLLAEKPAVKNNGKNIYPYKYFGVVEPDISELLSGKNIESIRKFKERVKKSMESPSSYNCGNDIVSDAERAAELLTTKKDAEIIEEIWDTTKSLFPNQYMLLQWVLDVVRSQRRYKR